MTVAGQRYDAPMHVRLPNLRRRRYHTTTRAGVGEVRYFHGRGWRVEFRAARHHLDDGCCWLPLTREELPLIIGATPGTIWQVLAQLGNTRQRQDCTS